MSPRGSSLESGAVASIHHQTSTFRQSIFDSLDARLALVPLGISSGSQPFQISCRCTDGYIIHNICTYMYIYYIYVAAQKANFQVQQWFQNCLQQTCTFFSKRLPSCNPPSCLGSRHRSLSQLGARPKSSSRSRVNPPGSASSMVTLRLCVTVALKVGLKYL